MIDVGILPRMKVPTFSLHFPDLMAHIPYQFYMKLCEIFLLTGNISKYWIQEDMFFLTIWFCLWSNIPLFVFELSYIFHTFENMKFPKFSWLLTYFPTLPDFVSKFPTFQGLQKFKPDSWFFQDFPYQWEPWVRELLTNTVGRGGLKCSIMVRKQQLKPWNLMLVEHLSLS